MANGMQVFLRRFMSQLGVGIWKSIGMEKLLLTLHNPTYTQRGKNLHFRRGINLDASMATAANPLIGWIEKPDLYGGNLEVGNPSPKGHFRSGQLNQQKCG